MERSCESFHDVSGQTVGDIGAAINRWGADIAINLDGWTSMGRTNEVFAITPAPSQVQYMGFPGTFGASFVPYLATDIVISPPELSPSYTEKLLLLPTYYINDYANQFPNDPPKQARSGRATSEARGRLGLPTLDGPVFVNLNNLYKVSPDMFKMWLSIIRSSPANATLSVLSLPSDAVKHLVSRAPPPPSPPLSFLDYVPKRQHMIRAAGATAFFDTLLVNAHTTAMDVAWACLPSVTLAHERFAARVGASILGALGCSHTLARTKEDYHDIGVKLARSTRAGARVRECLETARSSTRPAKMWDTKRWVGEWEIAMKMLSDVRASGNMAVTADTASVTPEGSGVEAREHSRVAGHHIAVRRVK